jgi:hypothetical protein
MVAGVVVLFAGHALAQELTGATSCADYLRMQAEDTQTSADQDVARRHVNSLMKTYSQYILRGPDGKALPTIIDFIISYSSHYCQGHPAATVADAGEAVGAAEWEAVANLKQR